MQQQTDREKLIKEISRKLTVMSQSPYRTTNFALLEYFSQNNFITLNQDKVISKLIEDYKVNPNKFVLADKVKSFASLMSFRSSIIQSIARNKSFISNKKTGEIS